MREQAMKRSQSVDSPESASGRGSEQNPHAPLGVRKDANLDAQQEAVLAALEAYDLAPIRDRLRKDGDMPSAWIDEAIREFRRYLALQVLDCGPVYMPSKQVDQVWHACLVHTRLYADLCDRAFGRFIHHDPVRAPDPEAAWTSFEQPYRRLFGEPGRLWQMWRPASVGGSHSDRAAE